MERKIEEQLVQELEEIKTGKDNKDNNKEDLTSDEVKENYSLNTINESILSQDPTYEHYIKDENTIKIIK